MACAIDRNPFSESVTAKPHGRVSVTLAISQAVVVFIFTIHARLSVVVLVLAAALYGLGHTFCHLSMMPHYNQGVNKCHAGGSLIYCWAVFCTIMLQIRNTPTVSRVCSLRPVVHVMLALSQH